MAWLEYPTNFSSGTVEGVYDFFIGYPSFILNDWYAGIIILILWVSAFGILSYSGTSRSMAAASFISAIFAIYFTSLGTLNPVVPIALILLTIIGAIGAKSETGL
jgi:hypothetical protein